MGQDLKDAIEHIVFYCGNLENGEQVVLLFDERTENLVPMFESVIRTMTDQYEAFKLQSSGIHGVEPPKLISESICRSNLVICLTYSSLAHTEARLESQKNGTRFLSLPMYSEMLLNDPSVLFPYKDALGIVSKMTELLTNGNVVEIRSAAGTRLVLDIEGRNGNCCPGFVRDDILLGSPPDVEANIAPLEYASNGKIVVDGSITCEEIGKLSTPMELIIENGQISEIHSLDISQKGTLEGIFEKIGSPKAYILGECGIGFNEYAQLTGNMLIDEGAFGNIHFGFGSNYTIQGANKVSFHLDFVILKPTMWIDGTCVMKDGGILI